MTEPLIDLVNYVVGDTPHRSLYINRTRWATTHRDARGKHIIDLHAAGPFLLDEVREFVLGLQSLIGSLSIEEVVDMASKKSKAKAKAVKKTKAPKAEGVVKELDAAGYPKRDTAAALFRELIMEGKKTDDAIFAQVQKKYDLEDKCRTHVAWYRGQLRKLGKNPPAAKAAK